MSDHVRIGLMLLFLAAYGNADDLTWDLLDKAMRLHIADRERHVERFLTGVLDDLLRRHCDGS